MKIRVTTTTSNSLTAREARKITTGLREHGSQGVKQVPRQRSEFGLGDQSAPWPAVGRAGWVAIVTGTGFMVLTASIMLFAPKLVLGIYVDTEAAKNAA